MPVRWWKDDNSLLELVRALDQMSWGMPEDEDRWLRLNGLRCSTQTDSSRGLLSFHFHNLTGFLEEKGMRRISIVGDGDGGFYLLLALRDRVDS